MADPKLVVALEARLNKFESDLKQAGLIADREVRNIEDKFAKANPRFGPGFLGGLFSGALGALSVGAVTNLIQNTVEGLAKIGDQADRVGLTAEQLQELRYALEQSGGQVEQAGPAMERFANNIAKAMEGEGKLGRFLDENNVKLKDRNGVLRPTADLLADVANLIQNAATPQERLNIAVEFFGRSAGPAMATALGNGAAGLRTLGLEARNAGTVLENELIKKAQEVDDKFQQMARTFSTTVKGAIISAIEAFEDFSEKVTVDAALDAGTYSAKQLAYAIELARKKGSPVDPSWIADLERLNRLNEQAAQGAGAWGGPPTAGSAFPNATNSGQTTNTTALHTRAGGAESKDAFERATYAAEKRIAVLRAENAVIGEGSAARERAKLVAELETAAKEKNKEAGLKNTEVTAEQRAEIDRLADSMLKVAQVAEAARGPLATFIRDGQDLNKNFQEAAVSGLRSFEDVLVNIGDKTTTTAEKFRAMTESILKDIGRILIRSAASNLLSGIFGGGPVSAYSGAGNPWSAGGMLPFGGARAGGGPVTPGKWYRVGEKGPEDFVPTVPGVIVPNGSRGANVTYAPSIDARGADVVAVARLEQVIARDRMEFEARVKSVVQGRGSKRW